MIDGVNAIALTRTPKIEADVLLLVRHDEACRLYLCEVKSESNNAWYATVELLRQLCLLTGSRHATRLFHRLRSEALGDLGVTGLVVASESFYSAPGQKEASVSPARQLVETVRRQSGLDVRLAVWQDESKATTEFIG